jgi:two-component system LytT family sensor kinase
LCGGACDDAGGVLQTAAESTAASPSVRATDARPGRGWIAYVLAWVTGALVWSLVSASSMRTSPLKTLPFGLLIMSVAGVLGVGVWRLTARLPWDRRGPRFYVTHLMALAGYAIPYAVALYVPEFVRRDIGDALMTIIKSPVIGWNLLMGSWLYIVVAALSYAVRADERRQTQALSEAEARELAQRAQLGALRAQLNHHFLFNALHSVSALVTTDPRAADEAIDRLGGLLRYTLSDDGHMVMFRNEWNFARDYLEFERLRLGDRLSTIIDITPDAFDVSVPSFVLQPLIENAVHHAVASRPSGGTISVAAHVDGDRLILRVSDDGPGSATPSARPGTGLSSLRRRLDAHYGDRAQMIVDSAPSRGFSVTVALPATAEETSA